MIYYTHFESRKSERQGPRYANNGLKFLLFLMAQNIIQLVQVLTIHCNHPPHARAAFVIHSSKEIIPSLSSSNESNSQFISMLVTNQSNSSSDRNHTWDQSQSGRPFSGNSIRCIQFYHRHLYHQLSCISPPFLSCLEV